jgi:PKD repeat protein
VAFIARSSRRRLSTVLMVLMLCSLSSISAHGEVVSTVTMEDQVDPLDGLDFALLQEGIIAPMEMLDFNIESLVVTVTDDPVMMVYVDVSFASEMPPDSSFSFVIYLDTDLDQSTGANTPVSYYNGLGADYNLGFITENGIITLTTIEMWNPVEGSFDTSGTCTAELGPSSLRAGFTLADLGDPKGVQMHAYVITPLTPDIAVADAVPNIGEEPPIVEFNRPPVAVLSAPTTVEEGTPVVLDGSGSYDFEGLIATYSFTFGEAEEITGESFAEFPAPDDMVYTAVLTVTDEGGLTSTTSQTVTVINTPPTGLSIIREGSEYVGEEATYHGSAVDPGVDDVLTYSWDFGDGATAEGPDVSHTHVEEGEYTVRLTVMDDDGGVGTEEMHLIVHPAPLLSTYIASSSIDASNPNPVAGDPVTFNVRLHGEGEEPSPVTVALYLDDPDREREPFWEIGDELQPGVNDFTSPEWFAEPGEHTMGYTAWLDSPSDVDPSVPPDAEGSTKVYATLPDWLRLESFSTDVEDPVEGDDIRFMVSVNSDGPETVTGVLKVYVDDPDRLSDPFEELDVELNPGLNEWATAALEGVVGDHAAAFVVEGDGFQSLEGGLTFNVGVGDEDEPGPDLLPILVGLLGLFGIIVYIFLTRTDTAKDDGKKKKKKKEGDFCEEHPEVVEQEEQACWDAQLKLSDALGSVRDQFNKEKPNWEEYSREVGRLMGEWDTAFAVIAKLTDAETQLYKDAAKVQEVAGLVTSASSKAKTAFKKGGEAAMKEVGKDFAKDMAKSIAKDVSQFAADLLSLEEWAKSTIGIGFAKLVTGIDPKKDACALRADAEDICDSLRSWVDHSEAWNQGRRPPDTLQSCLADMQKMYDAIGQAEKDFNDAVANFRCVDCEIPEELLKLMDQLTRELEDWMKAFGDMIDQVEKRLRQALRLFNRKDVYEHPYQFLNKSRRNSTYINRALNAIEESR